jgi:hypothetical protein
MCERDLRQSGYYGGGIAGQLNMRDFYNRCMEANGWTARTENQSAAPGQPKSALNACADEAERVANTRNSFDPTYKQVFDKCLSRSR